MEIWKTVLQVFNVLSALGVIGLVLMQHGKGADMGAAFGGGSSGGLFGATGAANFMSRSTAVCATIFFVTLFALVMVDAQIVQKNNIGVVQGAVDGSSSAPAVPVGNEPKSK